MKKFIKLAFFALSLTAFAAMLVACKEATEPAAKTELETPVIASAVYSGETIKADVPENAGYTVVKNDGGVSVGEYDVVLTLSDSEKYVWKSPDSGNAATVTVKFAITQAENAIKSLTMGDWYLGEAEKVPAAEAVFGTVVFTYSNAANGDYSATKPTTVGRFFVKASVQETSDYKGAEKTAAFNILKAKPSFTVEPMKIDGLKYDGGAHELVTAGAADGGTVEYKLGKDGVWSETVPSATDAGEYKVYYRIKGDETHADLEISEPIAVTIAETDFKFVAPTAKTGLVYNGAAQELVTAGTSAEGKITYKLGESGEYGEAVPSATTAGEYAVYYKLSSDSGNVILEQHVNVSIAKSSEILGFTVLNDGIVKCGEQSESFAANTGKSSLTLKFSRDKDGVYGDFDDLFVGTDENLIGNGLTYYVEASLPDDDCFENAKTILPFTLYHKFDNGVCKSCNHAQTGILYEVDGDVACVSGYNGNHSKEIYVNSVYNDKPVTYVKAGAFKERDIKKVVLPESVTELKGLVFFNCGNLEYLSMIGVTTFSGDGNNITFCHNLKTLIVKKGLTVTGQQLQSNQSDKNGITSVYVNGTAPITIENADLNKLIGNIYYLGDGIKCGTWKFNDSGDIVATLHNFIDGVCENCGERNAMGVNYVYSSATDGYYVAGYTGNSEVVTVFSKWDDGEHGEKPVTFVKFAAFQNNNVIKKVILPASVTTLDGCVFLNCSNLEYVEMKGIANLTKTTLGESNRGGVYDFNDFTWRNFEGCVKLTAIVVGKSFTVDKRMFHSDSVSKTIKIYTTAESAEEFSLNVDNTDDANNNAMLSDTVYYYSETEAAGCWHFVDGVPALWQTA